MNQFLNFENKLIGFEFDIIENLKNKEGFVVVI
jgi:hypothetical protein